MGKLVGMSVYLCGPIDACPDGGRSWRVLAKAWLRRRGVLVLDPLDKPVRVGLEDDDSRAERGLWKKAREYDRLSRHMKKVRAIDLRLVDKGDLNVVLLDTSIPMCGTYEELFWGNRLKRPTLVWCPQGKSAIPDWIFGTLPHGEFFGSLGELLAYLDRVDAGSVEPRTPERWLFVEPDLLYTPRVLLAIAASCARSWLRRCMKRG